jgi:hypothetical protein
MSDLRTFTLWARQKLVKETEALLLQIYGLEADGTFLPKAKLPILARIPEAMATRKRLEKLISDEQEASIPPADAYQKVVKEVAFTHLNRLVAFKLMEGRKLMRGAIDRYHDSNSFKIYLASHDADLKLFEKGSMPLDDFDEGPNDRAYRHFLLWQSAELAKEVRVLFDPGTLPSQIFPRPRILREIIDALNAEDMKEAWAPGNEETIGWVYQAFNAEELERAFAEARLTGKKFSREEIPSVTQLFTPRLAVRFLVDNTLGRLWLSMHPDSSLTDVLGYLAPLPTDPPKPPLKPVKEIRVLDPATGTMHFGLFAFDLFVQMYREELTNAGTPGWPPQASVENEEQIPAAIVANNLFGIDIDLRAVQLAALALYVRAKATNKGAVLVDSNLACADVTIFRGLHLASIAEEIGLPHGITRDLLQKFCESVTEAGMMGSLVRLEEHFQNIEAERLRKAIDDYVVAKTRQGIDESYFGSETSKGLRLLNVLTRRYDVVFTNPPYISARKMNADMTKFMKAEYPKAKGDLYAAFIQRCLELTSESGRTGMLTMHSFMFISSYEKLRNMITSMAGIETAAHYGPGLFDVGNPGTLQTAAFVLRRESFQAARQDSRGIYFRLVKESDIDSKKSVFEAALARRREGEADPHVYEYRQGDFAAIPGSPWVYWITPSLRQLFIELPQMKTLAEPKIGMRTGDNYRFLRFWWEVGVGQIGLHQVDAQAALATHKKWFPYMKGGDFRRWYGNQRYVLPWADDGAEIKENTRYNYPDLGESLGWKITNEPYYFRRGVTWSDLTGGPFSARLSPGGFIFDVKGSSAFPEDIPLVLGLLNSSFANYALNLMNPTVSYQVGDVARLPVPKGSSRLLCDLVNRVVTMAKADSEEDETAYDFISPPTWPHGGEIVTTRHQQVGHIEQHIDEEVFRLYEVSGADRKAIGNELTEPEAATESNDNDADGNSESSDGSDEGVSLTPEDLAKRWVSYAVGIALNRFQPGIEGALGCGHFNSETADQLRQLTDVDGLMVLEQGHADDLAARVVEILRLLHGDTQAEQIIHTAIGTRGAMRKSVEEYLLGPFFRDHVRRYRKRPVYWLFQSPDRQYSVYLFHERATNQTLAILQGKRYLGGRIHILENELKNAKRQEAAVSGREKAIWGKTARDVAQELEDLKTFDQHISDANNVPIKDAHGKPATAHWTPEVDDGVLLNAAALHELTPSWKRADAKLDLKKAWKDLEKGEFNWAKTAMRYWPQQVLKACAKNKSFAIAHGLA